jgi:hypothetical protein
MSIVECIMSVTSFMSMHIIFISFPPNNPLDCASPILSDIHSIFIMSWHGMIILGHKDYNFFSLLKLDECILFITMYGCSDNVGHSRLRVFGSQSLVVTMYDDTHTNVCVEASCWCVCACMNWIACCVCKKEKAIPISMMMIWRCFVVMIIILSTDMCPHYYGLIVITAMTKVWLYYVIV